MNSYVTLLLNGDRMMDDWFWFGMWFWMLGIWIAFVAIAILVYKDAEKRGMNGLLWLVLLIIPIPPLQVLVLVLYLILREERVQPLPPQKSATAILNERYARGEVAKEEYDQIRSDLQDQ